VAKGIRKRADEALLMALACGATVESAARTAGVSERTAFRRREDPDFRRRLERQRADMAQRGAGMLTAAAMEAVKTLVDLLQSSKPAPVRLGAARAILELGVRHREAAELSERIATLEDQLHSNRQAPHREAS
jgi:hypothetical protein